MPTPADQPFRIPPMEEMFARIGPPLERGTIAPYWVQGDITVRPANIHPNNFTFSDDRGNSIMFKFENGRFDAEIKGDYTLAAQTAANLMIEKMNGIVEARIREVRNRYESGNQD